MGESKGVPIIVYMWGVPKWASRLGRLEAREAGWAVPSEDPPIRQADNEQPRVTTDSRRGQDARGNRLNVIKQYIRIHVGSSLA